MNTKQVLLCCCYVLILMLNFMGMIAFCVRSMTCCLQERQPSYLCHNFTIFSNSLELELAWLVVSQINFAISLYVVSQVPEFLGWYEVHKKLIRLPKFWSFFYLLVVSLAEFLAILGFHHGTRLEETVVASFFTENLMTVVVVGVLNYTQLKVMQQRFHSSVRILIKLTLILFCVNNFAMFVIGSIQLSFNVTGLNRKTSRWNIPEDIETIFSVVRSAANVFFYHFSAVFFWQKIFIDKRNILSHFLLLEQPNRLLADDIMV